MYIVQIWDENGYLNIAKCFNYRIEADEWAEEQMNDDPDCKATIIYQEYLDF